jgi:hypothetical protein
VEITSHARLGQQDDENDLASSPSWSIDDDVCLPARTRLLARRASSSGSNVRLGRGQRRSTGRFQGQAAGQGQQGQGQQQSVEGELLLENTVMDDDPADRLQAIDRGLFREVMSRPNATSIRPSNLREGDIFFSQGQK